MKWSRREGLQPRVTFSLFNAAATTGVPLSREAERTISYILTHPEVRHKTWSSRGRRCANISDYPGVASAMPQRLGLLTEALPEFAAIDSLVVRDLYHRYTVDEHSLRTIEHLQELGDATDGLGAVFAALEGAGAARPAFSILTMLLATWQRDGGGQPYAPDTTSSAKCSEEAGSGAGKDDRASYGYVRDDAAAEIFSIRAR